MSKRNHSLPVFTVSHEEKFVSATISDKAHDESYIDVSKESKVRHEESLTRVGTAYVQADGSIYVQLYATPLNGKIIIKATKQLAH
ncbi:hypothetical protein SAMN04488109_1637 [Chryseolinea serpens]|uniref:Uncharacterized protein n=1 Tax=Chryseolinea serpens TaxID=947013 RepID=A0A1M5MA01_9BACT|nr:hypothetical protein [Chryseolinea serpens]SHG74100.1 hypothetical protein SAMN04488109_1637 [Chryseolinea serpens]